MVGCREGGWEGGHGRLLRRWRQRRALCAALPACHRRRQAGTFPQTLRCTPSHSWLQKLWSTIACRENFISVMALFHPESDLISLNSFSIRRQLPAAPGSGCTQCRCVRSCRPARTPLRRLPLFARQHAGGPPLPFTQTPCCGCTDQISRELCCCVYTD